VTAATPPSNKPQGLREPGRRRGKKALAESPTPTVGHYCLGRFKPSASRRCAASAFFGGDYSRYEYRAAKLVKLSPAAEEEAPRRLTGIFHDPHLSPS
jgi:hypothetical protein